MSLLLLFNSGGGGVQPPVLGTDGPILEALTAGTWTDITADVVAQERITWRRGISGSGPLDRVAPTGLMEFTLRNDAGNSGATLGWYSPNHASVRAGWTFGIACRLQYRQNNILYPLWRGKIRTIRPTAGALLERRVRVTAQDAMGDFAEYRVREVSTQVDQSETGLIQAVIDVLPSAAQPPAVQLDPGLDVYPFAFDRVGDGTNALSLFTDAVVSALGRLYVSANGTLTYRNRQNLAMVTSSLTVSDATLYGGEGAEFEVPSSLDSVYNRVLVTVHPKEFGPAATVLYAVPTVLSVGSGQTIERFGTYTDPDNTLQTVGGTDFQTLAAWIDYEGNSAEDGTGIDATTSLTVTAEPFASTVKFTINNNGSGTIYLVSGQGVQTGEPRLQLRGRPIYDNAPVTVESLSAESYGDRALEIDLPYQDNPSVAQDFADYLRTQYLNLANQAEMITLNPHAANLSLPTVLSLEIADVITASETMTGLSNVALAIQAIDGEIRPTKTGGQVLLRYRVAPSLSSTAWLLDDAVASVLDTTTVLGWV